MPAQGRAAWPRGAWPFDALNIDTEEHKRDDQLDPPSARQRWDIGLGVLESRLDLARANASANRTIAGTPAGGGGRPGRPAASSLGPRQRCIGFQDQKEYRHSRLQNKILIDIVQNREKKRNAGKQPHSPGAASAASGAHTPVQESLLDMWGSVSGSLDNLMAGIARLSSGSSPAAGKQADDLDAIVMMPDGGTPATVLPPPPGGCHASGWAHRPTHDSTTSETAAAEKSCAREQVVHFGVDSKTKAAREREREHERENERRRELSRRPTEVDQTSQPARPHLPHMLSAEDLPLEDSPSKLAACVTDGVKVASRASRTSKDFAIMGFAAKGFV